MRENARGPPFLWDQEQRKEFHWGRGYEMSSQNANVDYCGIIVLLRKLVAEGICTAKEAKKIAARIAAQNGVSIIVSL